VLIGLAADAYSSASQTISELSAIDVPTRSLWVLPGAIYTALVIAFGAGVWLSAGHRRAVRRVAWCILAYGALGLLWPFAPMHTREVLAAGGGTISDTLHLVLSGTTVALMICAMVIGSTAFGRTFRWYSLTSLVLLALFGAMTFLDAPGVSANTPTPWIGVWERINLGIFLLWIVSLAAVLWRKVETVTSGIGIPEPSVSAKVAA